MMVSNAEPPSSEFQVPLFIALAQAAVARSAQAVPSPPLAAAVAFSPVGGPLLRSCETLQSLHDCTPLKRPLVRRALNLPTRSRSSPQLDGALLEAPSSSSTRAFIVLAFEPRSRAASTQSAILIAQPADRRYGRTGDGAEFKETWQWPATRRQSRQAALWGPLLTGLVVWA